MASMSDVPRYDIDSGGDPYPDPEGSHVRYEDHAAALAAETARADHEQHEKETVADAFAAFKRYHDEQKADLTARADRFSETIHSMDKAVRDALGIGESGAGTVETIEALRAKLDREATARREAERKLDQVYEDMAGEDI